MHAVYQTAHHDLWWAKGQLWSAANWTLVLLTAVVGVGRLMYPSAETGLSTTWPLAVFVVSIALAAAWYLSRLHADIVHARSEIAFVCERSSGLNDLLSAIPNTREPAPDRTRGISFVIVLLTMVAVAVGIALIVLTHKPTYGVIAFIVQLAVGCWILYLSVPSDAA